MKVYKSAAIAALLAVLATPVAAMRVQPMSYELTPSGQRAAQEVRVENTGAKPMPVEILVERRKIGVNGEDGRTPAEEDFLVFPPQAIVPPNGFQNFRVQYIGNPSIAETALYVVTVAQLPVDTEGVNESGIKVLFSLGTSVAVSPVDAKAAVEISAVEPAPEAGKVRVTVVNSGRKFARLSSGVWTVTSGEASEELKGDILRQSIQQPLIEPGTTRIVDLPVSEGFVRAGAKATFTLSPSN